ncbi:Clp family protein, ATPase domain [Mycobacterium phage Myrna]|uniref:Clp family protein, ATPase domain n=1 Tax=Mycobacterium phage Myrna TaxID=546805 RepID=B5LJM1_9CAUD|nr:gp251 [Mycobacterium phage Myrna]ACH62218.1 Clp family protein, ATPase domain [Mycobacterium phage Myrna]
MLPATKGDEVIFERFTDRARRVCVLAQEEARMLNHAYIGTEHLLLGLVHEGEGVAAKALQALDINLEEVRAEVEEIIGHGQQAPTGHIPFTDRSKRVLELSLREALQLGHNYIGTEHLLLALIREGEGVGCQVLVKRGAELTKVRQVVIQLLSGYDPELAKKRNREEEQTTIQGQLNDTERVVEKVTGKIEKLSTTNTEAIIGNVYVVTKILNDHGIEPPVDLVAALIEWKGIAV